MFKNHKETIARLKDKIIGDQEIKAALVCGSVAHGFERKNSDLDVMFIISKEDYIKRKKRGELTYFDQELAVAPTEYIDGKYISLDFMKKVAEKGSEPARFAFEGAEIIFSNFDGLEDLLEDITVYPRAEKQEKIERFYAQFEAWKWYSEEAIKLNNNYLLNRAVNNLVLFGGRLILAENECLYPFHKWFLRALAEIEDKPEDLIKTIDDLMRAPDKKLVEKFYQDVKAYRDWVDSGINWPHKFLLDTELTWLEDKTPVADL
ncbi:nucleotidyltransferase domain-containing protein [Halanaerobium saccharolyticum]|uniref:nucleotidyltransferase domain-containing protein n=1 Tax=Halanaerobium saccharolyticum TaxID=43595 RepID=UPI003FCE70E4